MIYRARSRRWRRGRKGDRGGTGRYADLVRGYLGRFTGRRDVDFPGVRETKQHADIRARDNNISREARDTPTLGGEGGEKQRENASTPAEFRMKTRERCARSGNLARRRVASNCY